MFPLSTTGQGLLLERTASFFELMMREYRGGGWAHQATSGFSVSRLPMPTMPRSLVITGRFSGRRMEVNTGSHREAGHRNGSTEFLSLTSATGRLWVRTVPSSTPQMRDGTGQARKVGRHKDSSGVSVSSGRTGIAVGEGGTVLRTTTGGVTWIRDEQPAEVPRAHVLEQNYPNPFNPTTTIRYGLPTRSYVTLTVYSTLGQRVATLFHGEQEAGYHEAVFDASGLASGMYLYRLQAGGMS